MTGQYYGPIHENIGRYSNQIYAEAFEVYPSDAFASHVQNEVLKSINSNPYGAGECDEDVRVRLLTAECIRRCLPAF